MTYIHMLCTHIEVEKRMYVYARDKLKLGMLGFWNNCGKLYLYNYEEGRLFARRLKRFDRGVEEGFKVSLDMCLLIYRRIYTQHV